MNGLISRTFKYTFLYFFTNIPVTLLVILAQRTLALLLAWFKHRIGTMGYINVLAFVGWGIWIVAMFLIVSDQGSKDIDKYGRLLPSTPVAIIISAVLFVCVSYTQVGTNFSEGFASFLFLPQAWLQVLTGDCFWSCLIIGVVNVIVLLVAYFI